MACQPRIPLWLSCPGWDGGTCGCPVASTAPTSGRPRPCREWWSPAPWSHCPCLQHGTWLPFLAVVSKGEGISCRMADDPLRACPENKPSSARRELGVGEWSAAGAAVGGSLSGPGAASRPALPTVSRNAGAVVTDAGMLWQCSNWARGPRHLLSPQRSGRAVGVQPVCCSSGSAGWHCGTVAVPVQGHVVGITARLRRWPLGNQVSIWPRSGPGFPIPALISGIARYYSYHNNIPVPGSPLRCYDPAAGRMGRAGRRPLQRSVPLLSHGFTWAAHGPPISEWGWAQTPTEPGCGRDCRLPGSHLVQVPTSRLSCPHGSGPVPPECPGGTKQAKGWAWGQGRMAPSPA